MEIETGPSLPGDKTISRFGVFWKTVVGQKGLIFEAFDMTY